MEMDEKKEVMTEDAALLERLKILLIDKQKTAELDDKELAILRKMIGVYESFLAFGRFAGAARNVVLFVGGLLVAWFTLIDNFGVLWTKAVSMFGGGG